MSNLLDVHVATSTQSTTAVVFQQKSGFSCASVSATSAVVASCVTLCIGLVTGSLVMHYISKKKNRSRYQLQVDISSDRPMYEEINVAKSKMFNEKFDMGENAAYGPV